jgi:hypothetical protein
MGTSNGRKEIIPFNEESQMRVRASPSHFGVMAETQIASYPCSQSLVYTKYD